MGTQRHKNSIYAVYKFCSLQGDGVQTVLSLRPQLGLEFWLLSEDHRKANNRYKLCPRQGDDAPIVLDYDPN